MVRLLLEKNSRGRAGRLTPRRDPYFLLWCPLLEKISPCHLEGLQKYEESRAIMQRNVTFALSQDEKMSWRLIFVTKSPTGDKDSSREKYWASPDSKGKEKGGMCDTEPVRSAGHSSVIRLGEYLCGIHSTSMKKICASLCDKAEVTRHLFTRWTINYPPMKEGRTEIGTSMRWRE